MAIAATTQWECNASATANNVNGAGFNYANANFITDYTATSATGNSPVISSATYTFVAGDVDAWIYVQSGVNWTPGYYQITAVNGGAATVNAAVGAATQLTGGYWITNTVAGVATVASPTGGVCGIDFSRGTAAIINDTDLACADGDAAAPTITSAAKPFSVRYTGNLIKITAGTGYTVSWYEIVSVSGSTATLDRACGTDGAKTNGTFYVGGAASLGHTSDSSFFSTGVAGNSFWLKAGTFTLSTSLTSSANGTINAPYRVRGYNSVRADNPKLWANMPKIVGAVNVVTFGSFCYLANIHATGTGTTVITAGINSMYVNMRVINTSTTANRVGIGMSQSIAIGCECISYRGYAIRITDLSGVIAHCYLHHSQIGAIESSNTPATKIIGNIFESNTYGYYNNTATEVDANAIMNNTFFGGLTTKIGQAITFAQANSHNGCVVNNIITGQSVGIHSATASYSNLIMSNNFYNNTTDLSSVSKHEGNFALDPAFTSVTEVTGSTGTVSGSVLTDAGANFTNAVDGQYLWMISGTGSTNAAAYGIVSHTATTLTLDVAPGDSAVADKTYVIITNHNYIPGTNMKGVGAPTYLTQNATGTASVTVNYTDLGAVQRQEPGTSTDPGESNVLTGVNYTIEGVSKTGTLSPGGGGGTGLAGGKGLGV